MLLFCRRAAPPSEIDRMDYETLKYWAGIEEQFAKVIKSNA